MNPKNDSDYRAVIEGEILLADDLINFDGSYQRMEDCRSGGMGLPMKGWNNPDNLIYRRINKKARTIDHKDLVIRKLTVELMKRNALIRQIERICRHGDVSWLVRKEDILLRIKSSK